MSQSPTPAQRLQASRHAISAHLQGHQRSRSGAANPSDMYPDDDAGKPPGPLWWDIARHAMRMWWHNHPAYSAAQVARPVLAQYASDKPLQLLGVAAAAGAAIMLFKPWRLVPVGALLAATLKSPDVSGLIASILSQAASTPQQPRDPP